MPLDELHHQVVDVLAVLGFHRDVVGADDVLMVQSGDRLCLDIEALQDGRAFFDLGVRQDLDRTLAPHHLVLGQENGSHTASAQRPQQTVRTQEESLVFTLQYLVGLPAGEHLHVDQRVGNRIGPVQIDTPYLQVVPQLRHFIRGDEAASLDAI